MTASLQVEPADLRNKAAQLDVPFPATPAQPNPPCGLDLASVVVRQVIAEGDGMKSFIEAGQEEAKLLSLAFQGAAAAYEATDAAGRAALDSTVGEIIAAEIPQPAGGIPMPQMPIAACPGPPGYLDVEVAAKQIAQPDQAATLDGFATDWTSYASQLEARAEVFDLDALNWQGTAAEVAGTALGRHKVWLKEMAGAARTLAEHARHLAGVHRSAVAAHPTEAEVRAVTVPLRSTLDASQMSLLMVTYQELQARSEQVLTEYAAGSLITPVQPPTPPVRAALASPRKEFDRSGRMKKIDVQPTDTGSGGSTGGGSGDGTGAAGTPAQPVSSTGSGQPPNIPPGGGQPSGSGSPSGGGSPAGGGSSSGGGSPTGGGLPSGGLPGGKLPGGAKPAPELPDLGLDDPGVSPAGVGGGGAGGGGGGGLPSMPLQPNVGAETVAPGPAAARGGGSGGIPSAAMGAGMGGMAGGMGGMGHGGAQQGKEKRRDPRFAPDEELYVEDRPYTEPVIGNRRRRDIQDKDAK